MAKAMRRPRSPIHRPGIAEQLKSSGCILDRFRRTKGAPKQPLGKELALVKGTVRASVILRQRTFVIKDLQKQGNSTLDTPLGLIRITLPPEGIPATRPAVLRGGPAGGPRRLIAPSITLTLVEPDGQQKASGMPMSAIQMAAINVTLSSKDNSVTQLIALHGAARVPISGQGPFRLEITVPTKIAKFTLPVEFKHVPLP